MSFFCNQNMEWGIQCDNQCKDCHTSQTLTNEEDGLKDTFKQVIKEGIEEHWPLHILIMHSINKAEALENYEVAAKLVEAQKLLKDEGFTHCTST